MARNVHLTRLRNVFCLLGASLLWFGAPVHGADAATAAPLLVPASAAFATLGHSCGGIQEQALSTGFDAASGYPTGAVYLQTRCGGSGRGGGYHTTTYSAWVAATWDFTATMVSSVRLAAAPAGLDPAFSAFDANGNEVYNVLTSVNVLPANCTVGNTSYCTYRAYLTTQSGFVPAPRVTGVSVTSGPASGGTNVTITGTGFTGATGVAFGATAAAFTVIGDTSITAVTPAASAGVVDVTVTNAGGTSAPGAGDQFTFVAPPTVSGVSPGSGPAAGGTSVTITGANFTGASAVAFGGVPALFAVNNDSSITATSPAADAADSVDVTVTTPGGTSATSSADQFTFTADCTGACVSVGDASMLEGNSGTRNLTFAVTLSHPATTPVAVQYDVTDGTATGGSSAAAGADYKPASGTLTFTPSATTGLTPTQKSVSVVVFGDTTAEGDETFAVTLSNPTGGYDIGNRVGTGTILNDDDGSAPTSITAGVGDASITKTDAGTTMLGVPVTLSAPASGTTFSYVITPDTATRSATAAGGGDYGGKTTGTVTFSGSATIKTIKIPIWADPNVDLDESFSVSLSSVSNPAIVVLRADGTGTILGR